MEKAAEEIPAVCPLSTGGSLDKTAKAWDAASGNELLTLKGLRSGWSSSASARPNGLP
jgi:hypothetical protein